MFPSVSDGVDITEQDHYNVQDFVASVVEHISDVNECKLCRHRFYQSLISTLIQAKRTHSAAQRGTTAQTRLSMAKLVVVSVCLKRVSCQGAHIYLPLLTSTNRTIDD